ncbi:hypothetical protein [Alkalihalobacillus sp. LMS39]|nr:hypothetical protein [Alkalihalobacillus sp. LMS39]UOE92006.1 hypothetical protein MM271_12065 [Alkalihalobacillus sp. LMS39]
MGIEGVLIVIAFILLLWIVIKMTKVVFRFIAFLLLIIVAYYLITYFI